MPTKKKTKKKTSRTDRTSTKVAGDANWLAQCIMFALSIMTILQGILAELVMRTYYESQHKDPFVIRYIHTRVEKE